MDKREEILGVLESQLCDSMTGCIANPRGLGAFYDGSGRMITNREVLQEIVREGAFIEVPNAGAGSFREVFSALGFPDMEVFEWSSSAGNWSFVVSDGIGWMPAFQDNRHPLHGFRYWVNQEWRFDSKDKCFEFMSGGK